MVRSKRHAQIRPLHMPPCLESEALVLCVVQRVPFIAGARAAKFAGLEGGAVLGTLLYSLELGGRSTHLPKGESTLGSLRKCQHFRPVFKVCPVITQGVRGEQLTNKVVGFFCSGAFTSTRRMAGHDRLKRLTSCALQENGSTASLDVLMNPLLASTWLH